MKIRITHRRCRAELAEAHTQLEGRTKDLREQKRSTEGLCLEGRGHSISLGQQLDEAEANLQAAEHQLGEIKAACEDIEYARTDAAIPEDLREKLLDADDRQFVLAEHSRALDTIDILTEQCDRTLAAAHAAGMLARVYALMVGAGYRGLGEAGDLMAGMRFSSWTGFPHTWKCRSAECTEDTRDLVWHTDFPERAHLVCGCGRIWPAGPGAVDRSVAEIRENRLLGRSSTTERSWPRSPAPVLEAVDRALPPPAEARRAADAAALADGDGEDEIECLERQIAVLEDRRARLLKEKTGVPF
ncbi:hypothetical protein ABZ234_07865 [Nocardiopsis sp. NPDC006198]|uniref:hypothetical protein n=1 Tax=Nocardiopsis sp. NPDC006198 TaxID=3154472 RepID=UPI0033A3D8A9